MAPPNLSANVPADQRFRATYRIRAEAISRDLVGRAAHSINDTWQEHPGAVVIAPATAPTAGGSILGQADYFVSVDIKTKHVLPTQTWDVYLQPVRRISQGVIGWLGDVTVTLDDTDLLTPGQVSAQGRTQTAATAAAGSQQRTASLIGAVDTASKRLVLLAGLVLLIMLAAQFGPQLAAALKLRGARA